MSHSVNDDLVGGFNHFYCPFHIWDVILPIDELIFFRGVAQPPTSDKWCAKPAIQVDPVEFPRAVQPGE